MQGVLLAASFFRWTPSLDPSADPNTLVVDQISLCDDFDSPNTRERPIERQIDPRCQLCADTRAKSGYRKGSFHYELGRLPRYSGLAIQLAGLGPPLRWA